MQNEDQRLQLGADHQARWQTAVGRFVIAFGSMEAAAIEMEMEVSPGRAKKRLTFDERLDLALVSFQPLPKEKARRLCQALLVVKRLKRYRNTISHSLTHDLLIEPTEQPAAAGALIGRGMRRAERFEQCQ